METLTTDALIIKPKDSVVIKDISIDKKDFFEVKTTWTVSSVCNSERRRFNLTKSHTDSNAFVGGHEAVGVTNGEHYLEKSYALLPHSNCLTRNEKIKCPACHNNSENLCGHMRHAGLDENTPSGFVKQMFVPKSQLYDVSEIDLEIAPFLEPLSCVIRSWEKISFDYMSGVNEINIVGGGPIGSEFAQCFNRLGSHVTQVETLSNILAREDDEISQALRQQFSSEGIDLHTNTMCKAVANERGKQVMILDKEDQKISIKFDKLLIAVGRTANSKGFGLENIGIQFDKGNRIIVDDYLRTTTHKNIYACGDVVGPYQFTHTAAHQAWYCAVNALFSPFKKFKVDYRTIPWCTFTDPEIARVGLKKRTPSNKISLTR